ncbi:MAG: hypothetical protein DRQ01_02035 [Ignavibacteriae bacterium]|nr:MAG: hypothetical protein DRQ01_02035 [Ignavibacteriota bacterium]
MNCKIISFLIIISFPVAYAQPELDIKPNRIEFKDLFNRLDHAYLINKGNETLTIDSLQFKESLYLIDYDNNEEPPFSIAPNDSVKMSVILSGFQIITISDTSDTIYVYNDGINSPEPLRVKIDFFEDEYGDFTGTVTDSITLLENANVYFFYNGIYLLDTATTDVNGNYSATLPEGDYTIATEMSGYYVQFHDSTYDPYFAKIEELDSGEVITINFNMLEIEDTNFSVSGSIFDSLNGTPMDKGIIIVRRGKHVPTMKPGASLLLDTLNAFAGLIRPDGSFKVFVQQQNYYYLQAYTNYFLPGYYNDEGVASVYWQNADSLLINNVIIDKNVFLLRDSSYGAGSIAGSINIQKEGTQSDLEGITLLARSVDNGALYSYNFGKEDGAYRVSNLPFGTYELIGQKIGFDNAISQVVTIDPFNTQIINITITFTPTDVNDELPLPDNIILHQNYPNPFNPSTTISFYIPQEDFVELKISNILGETITILIKNNLSAGNYNIQFDASNFASGIYFYTLRAGKFIQTNKMLLLK